MRKHVQRPEAFAPSRAEALLFAAGILLIGFFALNRSVTPIRSVEVSFTDESRSGMHIVPASCASLPPPLSEDSKGYKIPSGTSGALVYGNEHYFCVSNSGGPTYFLPHNSPAEIQSFIDALPTLQGASHIPGPDLP